MSVDVLNPPSEGDAREDRDLQSPRPAGGQVVPPLPEPQQVAQAQPEPVLQPTQQAVQGAEEGVLPQQQGQQPGLTQQPQQLPGQELQQQQPTLLQPSSFPDPIEQILRESPGKVEALPIQEILQTIEQPEPLPLIDSEDYESDTFFERLEERRRQAKEIIERNDLGVRSQQPFPGGDQQTFDTTATDNGIASHGLQSETGRRIQRAFGFGGQTTEKILDFVQEYTSGAVGAVRWAYLSQKIKNIITRANAGLQLTPDEVAELETLKKAADRSGRAALESLGKETDPAVDPGFTLNPYGVDFDLQNAGEFGEGAVGHILYGLNLAESIGNGIVYNLADWIRDTVFSQDDEEIPGRERDRLTDALTGRDYGTFQNWTPEKYLSLLEPSIETGGGLEVGERYQDDPRWKDHPLARFWDFPEYIVENLKSVGLPADLTVAHAILHGIPAFVPEIFGLGDTLFDIIPKIRKAAKDSARRVIQGSVDFTDASRLTPVKPRGIRPVNESGIITEGVDEKLLKLADDVESDAPLIGEIPEIVERSDLELSNIAEQLQDINGKPLNASGQTLTPPEISRLEEKYGESFARYGQSRRAAQVEPEPGKPRVEPTAERAIGEEAQLGRARAGVEEPVVRRTAGDVTERIPTERGVQETGARAPEPEIPRPVRELGADQPVEELPQRGIRGDVDQPEAVLADVERPLTEARPTTDEIVKAQKRADELLADFRANLSVDAHTAWKKAKDKLDDLLARESAFTAYDTAKLTHLPDELKVAARSAEEFGRQLIQSERLLEVGEKNLQKLASKIDNTSQSLKSAIKDLDNLPAVERGIVQDDLIARGKTDGVHPVRIQSRVEIDDAQLPPVDSFPDVPNRFTGRALFNGGQFDIDLRRVNPSVGSTGGEFGFAVYLTDDPDAARAYASGTVPSDAPPSVVRGLAVPHTTQVSAQKLTLLDLNNVSPEELRQYRKIVRDAASEVLGEDSDAYDAFITKFRKTRSPHKLANLYREAIAETGRPINELGYRQFQLELANRLQPLYDGVAYSSKRGSVLAVYRPEKLVIQDVKIHDAPNLTQAKYFRRQADYNTHRVFNDTTTKANFRQSDVAYKTQILDDLSQSYAFEALKQDELIENVTRLEGELRRLRRGELKETQRAIASKIEREVDSSEFRSRYLKDPKNPC